MPAPPPSASEPLAHGLIARFADGLARAAARPVDPAELVALAVSGGPDSMAMLALAHAARPGRVIAATFDHGLREAGAAEAAMVARWCHDHAVPHATLMPPAPLPRRAVQATARAARYAALADWAAAQGAALLATAHHADDQAETFLMRANRASGPAGLAGIRRRRMLGPVMLVRPLLDWRRAELVAVAEAAGLPVAHDPSNRDPRYTRTRARGWLAALPDLDAGSIARAAGHVADLADDLDALVDWAWATRRIDPATIDVADLPRALRRPLLRRLIAEVRATAGIDRPAFTPDTGIEPLLDALEAGRRATQAGILLTPAGRHWSATPAPPRRPGG